MLDERRFADEWGFWEADECGGGFCGWEEFCAEVLGGGYILGVVWEYGLFMEMLVNDGGLLMDISTFLGLD